MSNSLLFGSELFAVIFGATMIVWILLEVLMQSDMLGSAALPPPCVPVKISPQLVEAKLRAWSALEPLRRWSLRFEPETCAVADVRVTIHATTPADFSPSKRCYSVQLIVSVDPQNATPNPASAARVRQIAALSRLVPLAEADTTVRSFLAGHPGTEGYLELGTDGMPSVLFDTKERTLSPYKEVLGVPRLQWVERTGVIQYTGIPCAYLPAWVTLQAALAQLHPGSLPIWVKTWYAPKSGGPDAHWRAQIVLDTGQKTYEIRIRQKPDGTWTPLPSPT